MHCENRQNGEEHQDESHRVTKSSFVRIAISHEVPSYLRSDLGFGQCVSALREILNKLLLLIQ